MHGVSVGLVLWLLACSYVWLVNSKTRQIDSSHHSRFVHEVTERKSHRDTRQARQNRQSDPPETKCNYSIALLDFPPYIMNSSREGGLMYEKIKWFVDFTCFNKEENDPEVCIMMPIYVRNWLEMVELIKTKRVDFAFPIQADARQALKGEPDVTIIRAFVSSGVSLIVNMKQCQEESREELFTSLTSQWPILVAMILLSGISGIIIWLLERRAKEGQFSSSFTAGLPEGYWWAVLSLATVGYGDVTPKSVPGRVFGIIWVLVGAVVMSLFTATVVNVMQTAVDGTKCKDIEGKEIGFLLHNTEVQGVATHFEAKYIMFSNLKEMQRNLRQGIVGRVLVDRNTAFHFLDNSDLKRNRQIRLIRNIEYPLEYYLAHVKNDEVPPTQFMSPNDTDDSDTELVERKMQLAECGPYLKELSVDFVSVAKVTAEDQFIPAELQTTDLEGLFSTDLDLTMFALYCLVGIFLGLIFIGVSCEVYTKCHARRALNRRKEYQQPYEETAIPLDSNVFQVVQYISDLEERLKASITVDIQKMQDEIVNTLNRASNMNTPCTDEN